MGYVTYATADTWPTPILRTAFFSTLDNVMKEMREQPHKCSISQTKSGAGQGMAVREGSVTALEVCPYITNMFSPPERIEPSLLPSIHRLLRVAANQREYIQVFETGSPQTTYHLIHLASKPGRLLSSREANGPDRW